MFETEKILSNKMKYLVYLTYCIASKKYYVGVHMTKDPNIWDFYLGNGIYTNRPASYKKATTPLKRAVCKYGINSFRRIILAIFNTKEEAYNLEALIVNESFIKSSNTYNIKLGGSGGCPEVLKKKIYMYDSNGEFVKEFNTLKECMCEIAPHAKNQSHISRAIKTGTRVYNYQFSYEKVPCMKNWNFKVNSENYSNAQRNRTYKKVGKYDDNGNLLEVFNTSADMRKAGYRNAYLVLKGKRIHCNGYKFKYIEE